MEYNERIQLTIDYIEEHLDQPIRLQDLAKLACFSDFHYHRLFQFMVGDSVMDYIRKRRLSKAALALAQTKQRVIDIALDHGFQTHETFARAFKRHFQVTPVEYRRKGYSLSLQPKMELPARPKSARGGHTMKPTIVTKPAFKVIGYALETSVNEGRNHVDIPAFWQHYLREQLWKNIPNKVRPDVELGICGSFVPETGALTYIIGYEVDTFEGLPEGLVTYTVPEATYAVFTTPKCAEADFPASIQSTWASIYQNWFPTSGYEHDGKPEMEWYDDRCRKDTDLEMDIYLPIMKKEAHV